MADGRGCASTGEGKKGKGVGRSLGAAAWLGVRASGVVGACPPLPGVARTRECALRWCGGAVKRVRPGERKEKNSAAGPTRQRAGAR
jgi:hypothetical protein